MTYATSLVAADYTGIEKNNENDSETISSHTYEQMIVAGKMFQKWYQNDQSRGWGNIGEVTFPKPCPGLIDTWKSNVFFPGPNKYRNLVTAEGMTYLYNQETQPGLSISTKMWVRLTQLENASHYRIETFKFKEGEFAPETTPIMPSDINDKIKYQLSETGFDNGRYISGNVMLSCSLDTTSGQADLYSIEVVQYYPRNDELFTTLKASLSRGALEEALWHGKKINEFSYSSTDEHGTSNIQIGKY